MPDDAQSPLAPLTILPFWLVIVWARLSPPPETALRTIGGIAQLAGVALVLVAVDASLNPAAESIPVRMWRWLQQKVRRLTRTIHVSAHDVTLATSSANVGLSIKERRAMSEIERRLKELEAAHRRLSKQVDRIDSSIDDMWQKLDSKAATLHDSIRALEKASQTATRKRARWDLGGAAFFAQGIILTTWPRAIARWLA